MSSAAGLTHAAPRASNLVPPAVSAALAERRYALRVPVDRSLKVWNRLRRLDVTLRDLSLSGCRLLCQEPLIASATLWLWLPGGLGGRLRHPVRGEVVWAESVSGERTGVCHAAVRFRPLFASTTPRIQRALEVLLMDDASQGAAGESPSTGERRAAGERVSYERRVISRGSGRPRVLIGQDLSVGGMRIANEEGLEVGVDLQVALHAGGAVLPVVVEARVVRQGEAGAALEFIGVDAAAQELLQKLVSEHPRLIGADGQPVVVSEIVDGDVAIVDREVAIVDRD